MLATRDAVFASRTGSLSSYYVISDNGPLYRVLGPAGPDWIFATSERTGIVIAVLRTGTKRRDGLLRVKIHFPIDTMDVHGTLDFDAGMKVGGRANACLFA